MSNSEDHPNNHVDEHPNMADIDEEERALDLEYEQLVAARNRIEEKKQRNAAMRAPTMTTESNPIQSTNQSVNAPRLEQGRSTPHSVNAHPAARALSFGATPRTVVTNGRFDRYASFINRRQTLSSVEPLPIDDNDSGSEISASRLQHVNPPTRRVLTITGAKGPNPFDGTIPANKSPLVFLNEFFDQLERFLAYECDRQRVDPTPDEWMKFARLYIVGTASGVADDVELIAYQQGRFEPIEWPEIRAGLIEHFAHPEPAYSLVASMMKLEQRQGESVRDFTSRFNALHAELATHELASRDLSTALYLHALLPPIRARVTEQVASVEYFKEKKIGPGQAREALSCLFLLALARETALASRKTVPPPTTHTASRSAPSASAVATTSSTAKRDDQSASLLRQKIVETVTVPDELFNARKAAGVCGRCNGQHKTFSCRFPRNLTPAPTTGRSNVRANVMDANESVGADPTAQKN
jgi:hypothetical protein